MVGGTVIVVSVGVFAATIGAQPRSVARSGRSPIAAHLRPPDPGALKVLVVGDSQAATLAQGVRADPGVYGLSAQPGLTVWNRAILGCSIVSFPVFVIDGNQVKNKCGGAGFWQQQWAGDVATFRPDAVVVMAGAWDVFDAVMPDGSVAHAGNAEFDATYQRDVGTLVDTLSATGAPVVVVKPPCYGESQLVGTDPQIPERRDTTRLRAIDAAWTAGGAPTRRPGAQPRFRAVPRRRRRRRGAPRRRPLRRRRCRRGGARGGPSGTRRRSPPTPRPAPRDPQGAKPSLVVLTVAAMVAAGCQSGSQASRSVDVPPPTSTATRPIGNPWPQIGAAPPEHHAILSMGDSLMGGTYSTLPGVLAAHGFDAAVYDAHVNGSGLLDPMNGSSARDYLALQLAAHPDVDTVIFEWAASVATSCGPDTLAYGSPEFFAAWHAAAGDLIRDAYGPRSQGGLGDLVTAATRRHR